MDMNDSSSPQNVPAEKKKTYEKPSFRYEQVFVTTALGCSKAHRHGAHCTFVPTKS
jgi:hypothetical protein